MTDLLLLLLMNSLAICGLHLAVCGEGMILGFIARAGENWPGWIKKPLYDCPTCMASVHSVWMWLGVMPALGYENPLWLWPVYAFALAGLNTILYLFSE